MDHDQPSPVIFLTFANEYRLGDLAEEERRLYLSLAIFKEDEAIPQVAINHLWAELAGYPLEDTTDLLHDLASRALLQFDSFPRF